MSRQQREAIASGRKLFSSVGCAACHIEKVDTIEGIYSDLLLHDMGPALADPILAEASLTLLETRLPQVFTSSIPGQGGCGSGSFPSRPAGYFGGSSLQTL